jgi:hypothetical protein
VGSGVMSRLSQPTSSSAAKATSGSHIYHQHPLTGLAAIGAPTGRAGTAAVPGAAGAAPRTTTSTVPAAAPTLPTKVTKRA